MPEQVLATRHRRARRSNWGTVAAVVVLAPFAVAGGIVAAQLAAPAPVGLSAANEPAAVVVETMPVSPPETPVTTSVPTTTSEATSTTTAPSTAHTAPRIAQVVDEQPVDTEPLQDTEIESTPAETPEDLCAAGAPPSTNSHTGCYRAPATGGGN